MEVKSAVLPATTADQNTGQHHHHPSEYLEFISFDHIEDCINVEEGKGTQAVCGPLDCHEERSGSTASGFPPIARAALTATRAEHGMTVHEAVRIYPKAIGWAVGISFAIIVSLPHVRKSELKQGLTG
jgi:hypothetical protein